MTTVGVLALQGDFAEHEAVLEQLGVAVREVRTPAGLEGIDALIIPGGESTTLTRLIAAYGLIDPIRRFAAVHPVWGTCAGMIVMARQATNLDRPTLDLIDVAVERNAFGAQVDSFETEIEVDGLDGEPYPAVFIRAPVIRSAGEGVRVLAELEDGRIVAARQGRLLVTAFHPELTRDTRLHAYFLSFLNEARPNEGVMRSPAEHEPVQKGEGCHA
jgi:5'-phosphate synthase pdxT subunit